MHEDFFSPVRFEFFQVARKLKVRESEFERVDERAQRADA